MEDMKHFLYALYPIHVIILDFSEIDQGYKSLPGYVYE